MTLLHDICVGKLCDATLYDICVTQLNVSRHLAMFLDCSFIMKYYFEIISSLCVNAINLDDKTVFITQ